MSANVPRGAGLGRDADRRRPGLVDFDWTMQHGSRAQRREIARRLKAAKRGAHPDDVSVIDDLATRYLRPASEIGSRGRP